MKELENFSRYLKILKNADFNFANENEIYRMGVLCYFSITFELACGETGALAHALQITKQSARSLILRALDAGLIKEEDKSVWFQMMQRDVLSSGYFNVYRYFYYAPDKVYEYLRLIHEQFIDALEALEKTLKEKLEND